jgi:hypothetical protein
VPTINSRLFHFWFFFLVGITLMASEKNKMVLKSHSVLVKPNLKLWVDYPGFSKARMYWDGVDANTLKVDHFGDQSPDIAPSTMGVFLNSLVKPGQKHRLKVVIDLPKERVYDFEKDKIFGVAATVFANFDPENSRMYFDDPNHRIAELAGNDVADARKHLDGTEKVRSLGLQSWFGPKEEISGRSYVIEIDIDGSDPDFVFQEVEVKDFVLTLNNNFLPGHLKVNGVDIANYFHLRPVDNPTLLDNSAFTYLPPHWSYFLTKGQNTLSYEIAKPDNYLPHENDAMLVQLYPHKFENRLDPFGPRLLIDAKITGKTNGWSMDLDIPDYPLRA